MRPILATTAIAAAIVSVLAISPPAFAPQRHWQRRACERH